MREMREGVLEKKRDSERYTQIKGRQTNIERQRQRQKETERKMEREPQRD